MYLSKYLMQKIPHQIIFKTQIDRRGFKGTLQIAEVWVLWVRVTWVWSRHGTVPGFKSLVSTLGYSTSWVSMGRVSLGILEGVTLAEARVST